MRSKPTALCAVTPSVPVHDPASVDVTRPQWEQAIRSAPEISPNGRYVALYLHSRMGTSGQCWPSQVRIAGETGLSRATLNRKLNELKVNGYIQRSTRPGGVGRTSGGHPGTLYRACVPGRRREEFQPTGQQPVLSQRERVVSHPERVLSHADTQNPQETTSTSHPGNGSKGGQGILGFPLTKFDWERGESGITRICNTLQSTGRSGEARQLRNDWSKFEKKTEMVSRLLRVAGLGGAEMLCHLIGLEGLGDCNDAAAVLYVRLGINGEYGRHWQGTPTRTQLDASAPAA